jgi:hypothetical protein
MGNPYFLVCSMIGERLSGLSGLSGRASLASVIYSELTTKEEVSRFFHMFCFYDVRFDGTDCFCVWRALLDELGQAVQSPFDPSGAASMSEPSVSSRGISMMISRERLFLLNSHVYKPLIPLRLNTRTHTDMHTFPSCSHSYVGSTRRRDSSQEDRKCAKCEGELSDLLHSFDQC